MIFKKLILILFFFPILLTAQKTFEFPAQMDKMSGTNELFKITKVIDARGLKNENYIGRVQTGAFNIKNDALLKKPLADELITVINQLLPKTKDSLELILKVSRLKVWEQTYLGTEEGYAFADFELVLKRDTTHYVIDNYNGFIRKRSGWDVTSSHIKNLTSILKLALDTFQKHQNWLNLTTGLQRLSANDVLIQNTPSVLLDSVRRKGMYRHFGEFLSNKPTLPMAYREYKGKKTVITVDENGQKKELDNSTDVWGFCDGKDIFVCQMGSFFLLQFQKDKVSFEGYDVQKQVKRQQTGAILFGVIGATIASANKGDLELMRINMDSGECIPSK